jgi:hypothetical protein
LAKKIHRAAARLAGGCALILAFSLFGCATPGYADVSVPKTSFHFQIPRSWNQINSSSLASWLKARNYDTGTWIVGYDASPQPRAADTWNYDATRPFLIAQYLKLSSNGLEGPYGQLRDIYLPVTSAARQYAIAHGFRGTSFRHIRDQLLSLGPGTHGFRETYDYTLAGGRANTFDEDVVINADHTAILLLVVHCTTTCYSSYRTEIDYVMSSLIQG